MSDGIALNPSKCCCGGGTTGCAACCATCSPCILPLSDLTMVMTNASMTTFYNGPLQFLGGGGYPQWQTPWIFSAPAGAYYWQLTFDCVGGVGDNVEITVDWSTTNTGLGIFDTCYTALTTGTPNANFYVASLTCNPLTAVFTEYQDPADPSNVGECNIVWATGLMRTITITAPAYGPATCCQQFTVEACSGAGPERRHDLDL